MTKEDKALHTPGPWRYLGRDNGNFRIYAPDGLAERSGPVADAMHRFFAGERAANARLISAAPELLSALEALVACDDDLGLKDDDCGYDGESCPYATEALQIALAAARAAISKAKGQV